MSVVNPERLRVQIQIPAMEMVETRVAAINPVVVPTNPVLHPMMFR